MVSFIFEKWLQVNHALWFYDIYWRLVVLYDSLEFSIGRSIIIGMDNRIFDEIPSMDLDFELCLGKEVIVNSLRFRFANRTRSGSDNFLYMICFIFYSVPECSFSCSGRTREYEYCIFLHRGIIYEIENLQLFLYLPFFYLFHS